MNLQTSQNSLRLYVRILSYLKPYVRHIVVILLFNFGFIVFNTLSIWLVAPFVSTLFQAGPAQEQVVEQHSPPASMLNINAWLKEKTADLIRHDNRLETLKMLSLLVFLGFLLKNAFAFGEAFLVSFVEQHVIKDLRDQLYAHIIHQPLQFFERYNTGNLMSRITNDINALNVAVNRSFTKIIRDPLMIVIFVALLISISWQLTLLAFLVIPVSGFIIQKTGQSLKRKSHRVQERIANLTSILQETISGIRVVKAFGMESYEIRRFREQTQAHFRAVLRQVRLNRLSGPLSETLGVGIMACVLWFGGQLVLAGRLLSAEDFIRFLAVLFAVMEPIKSLGNLNNNIQIALASGQRIFSVLDTPSPIVDAPQALPKRVFSSDIEFRDVWFRYHGHQNWVLRGIRLQIEREQKVALVGPSGAGKTTLANLLPRFYDVTRGAVCIDGCDIRNIRTSDLRRLMGVVTQEVILFNDTVANNIAYGSREYTLEQIEEAARLANALEFIRQLPEGFHTVIGERGVRLSGGQRQRLSIARAILKNPPILIFDEATSSLDSEAERLIQQAIANLLHRRTVLMIAHRLASIIHSDLIVVMEEGRIVDMGSHEELLERNARYRRLCRLQFTGSWED